MQIVAVMDSARRQWVQVALSGDLDSATSTAILWSAFGALLRVRPKGISIDLGGVESVGPQVLAVLRAATVHAGETGTWVDLVNAPLPVHRTLAADPVLQRVLEAYAWRQPAERSRRAALRPV